MRPSLLKYLLSRFVSLAVLSTLGLGSQQALAENSSPQQLTAGLLQKLHDLQPDPSARRLVVLDLQPQGENPAQNPLGAHLAELLLPSLISDPSFRLLERQQIKSLLQEQGFSQSAFADPEQAAELGRLSGAQLLLLGSYRVESDQVSLSLRLVEVSTGAILALSQGALPKTDAMRSLLGEKTSAQFQQELAGNLLGLVLDQLKQHPVSQRQTPPAQQLVFFEDFAKFAPNTPAFQFGPDMFVRSSQRYPMHVLKTENPATQGWGLKLAFPQNFVLELHAIDTLLDPRQLSLTPLSLILRDVQGRPLVIEKEQHQFRLAGQSAQPSNWRYQDWNTMALVKQNENFSWYINGQLVASQQIVNTQAFSGFEVVSPSLRNWAFTHLALHRL